MRSKNENIENAIYYIYIYTTTIFYACCRSMSIELCNRQLATVHFAPGPAAHLSIVAVVVVVVFVVVIVISIEVH